MNKDISEEGDTILEVDDSKVIFNGEEIPIKKAGKGVENLTKKNIRQDSPKDIKKELRQDSKKFIKKVMKKQHGNSQEVHEIQNQDSIESLELNENGQQQDNLYKKERDRQHEENRTKTLIEPKDLEKAIVWAEILGSPVCKTRSARRQGRKSWR